MDTFQRGETVICSLQVKNSAGTLVNPDTSTKVTITDPNGSAVVGGTAMTNDSTGNYHYDYTSGGAATLGVYSAKFEAIDSGRTTIAVDRFRVEG